MRGLEESHAVHAVLNSSFSIKPVILRVSLDGNTLIYQLLLVPQLFTQDFQKTAPHEIQCISFLYVLLSAYSCRFICVLP